jgi:hypothetical protein
MWITKGAFRRPVKEKCHEPDMDDRGKLVFDVMERQQNATNKFTSAAYVLFRGIKSCLQGSEQ